jgi:hypothetical protein
MPFSSHYQSVINRLKSESVIRGSAVEYFNKFIALQELRYIIEDEPHKPESEAISFIGNLLLDTEFSNQRQVYFFYRQAAEALRALALYSNDSRYTTMAMDTLTHSLRHATGPALRATAEALGALPFKIRGPAIPEIRIEKIPSVSCRAIFDSVGSRVYSEPRRFGRSLVFEIYPPNQDRLLVLKLARQGDRLDDLGNEVSWMEFFQAELDRFKLRFNVPSPIRLNGCRVFRIKDLSSWTTGFPDLHAAGFAIGFVAHRDYFVYPNRHNDTPRYGSNDNFMEIICRNARLLGQLTASGIVHDAPIPLFHNRQQAGRRHDEGMYLWFRGGRLDRWLASCEYPNLGPTGIRDFEHFFSLDGWDRNLYRYIGNHLLSLLLVTGSFFRNKKPTMVGLDDDGLPIDARPLFNKNVLKEMVINIFTNYYKGFTGLASEEDLPIDIDRLIDRMIEEMGVDRHMTEIFRVVDQKNMSDTGFKKFLMERGYEEEKVRSLKRGAQDLIIHSGPHLGEFNRTISLPEIIDAISSISAMCLAGRYRRENRLN